MIPSGGFISGLPIGEIPTFDLGDPVILAYRQGVSDFEPATSRYSDFQAIAITRGSFEADIIAGQNQLNEFGVAVRLIREGVYGTILVDRVIFNDAMINLIAEGCPDITEPVDEDSITTTLESEDACPRVTVVENEPPPAVPIVERDT